MFRGDLKKFVMSAVSMLYTFKNPGSIKKLSSSCESNYIFKMKSCEYNNNITLYQHFIY